eukprot:TRINITY_DN6889_c0_g1_i1.p1 TRINITY_DN6889_c0_g1~~TRINITY_DN6889_c0_g1_i1.p1  ORF type:complete len:113 (+),score=2.32 TRINITY_DN6889_c0_g1_i1:116-454(+)
MQREMRHLLLPTMCQMLHVVQGFIAIPGKCPFDIFLHIYMLSSSFVISLYHVSRIESHLSPPCHPIHVNRLPSCTGTAMQLGYVIIVLCFVINAQRHSAIGVPRKTRARPYA